MSHPATLLAQIAPQRSTQYATLASALAPFELALSPLPIDATEITPITLGGQAYLHAPLHAPLTDARRTELGTLALTGPFFEHFPHAGELVGPLLRPIETGFSPALPPELVQARRYRGKTNELFTHFLCNLARFSSQYRETPWPQLRVLDPLAGGGTTLFTGLVLGASVAGIEQDAQDVKSTVAFMRQFMREQRLPARVKEEQLRRLPDGGRGQRWTFALGRQTQQQCILARGDTRQAAALVPGFRPHLIVTDLPYGVQHHGPLTDLLSGALPVWESLLAGGGALAFAWDATRFPRAEMAALVESVSSLVVRHAPPYDQLAHPVDRVIKARDVLVAQRI